MPRTTAAPTEFVANTNYSKLAFAQKQLFGRYQFGEENGRLWMANDLNLASEGQLAERFRAVEQVFRALPPLGSPQYIEHISSATARELPPEVLARALVNYRQTRQVLMPLGRG